MHVLQWVNRLRTRTLLMGVLAGLILDGCGRPSPGLQVDGVAPGRVPSGVQSTVTLQGDFEPSLLLNHGKTTLEEDYQVEVGGQRASSVHLRPPDTLEVTLPTGLTPGFYDIRVTGPQGAQVALAKGLEVYASGPGPFDHYRLSKQDGPQVAGVPFTVTLEAVDANDNPVPEVHQVSLSALGTAAGTLSPTSSGPFTGSVALSVTLTQASTNVNLVASDGTAQATSGSFAVLPGALQRFAVDNVTSSQTAGVPFAVTVHALDVYGNETQDVVNDVSLAADGAAPNALSPATSGSFVGHVTLQVVLTQALTGTRISVSAAQLNGQQTAPFDVLPGPLARFDLFPPGCVVSGVGFLLNAQASDQYGNRVPGYNGTVTFSAQTRFSPGQSPTFSSGAVSILNAMVSRVGTVPRTVLLQAVDPVNSTLQGSVVLNVQPSCP